VAFFDRLYTALAVGFSLDQAVAGARRALLEPGVLSRASADTWGQFVVYMPTDDPVLLPAPASLQTKVDQANVLNVQARDLDRAEYLKAKLVVPDVEGVDLTVTVSRQGDLFVGGEPMGTVDRTALTALADKLTLIGNEDVQSQVFYEDVGSQLFAALFRDRLEEIYRSELKKILRTGRILRINLLFDPSDLLAPPWEYLYDSKNKLFLGSDSRTALSRRIYVEGRPRALTLGGPLKVLAVISRPQDLEDCGFGPIDREKEYSVLQEALTVPGLPDGEQPIQLRCLDGPASGPCVRTELEHFEPHILHLIAHGRKAPGAGFELVTADEENRVQFMSQGDFVGLVRGRRQLRLIVLATCHSGLPDVGSGMLGLAPALLAEKIPAALVMQHRVLESAARKFSLQFYNALLDGNPIDYAVNLARDNLRSGRPDQRAFGTPVLYTQVSTLFEAPKPDRAPKENARAPAVS
jgi:hypothetical protein